MDSSHGSLDLTQMRNTLSKMLPMHRWRVIWKWIPYVGSTLGKVLPATMEASQYSRDIAMIDSMTPTERSNPDCITYERCMRIARGSGMKAQEVQEYVTGFIRSRRFFDDQLKMD